MCGCKSVLDISTHTPRERRDPDWGAKTVAKLIFQLTRLVRGVTYERVHNSPAAYKFQLTRLVRGVTDESLNRLAILTFQLTRLVRGVTTNCTV